MMRASLKSASASYADQTGAQAAVDWSMLARSAAPTQRAAGFVVAEAPVSPTFGTGSHLPQRHQPRWDISSASYWDSVGVTANKWGSATAGTGATISYIFEAASAFTATEQATFLKAFAMWESVANVHFVVAGQRDRGRRAAAPRHQRRCV